MWLNGNDPPKSCHKAHSQYYWSSLEEAQTECDKWSKCRYLQQTEKTTPGKPGHPVWFARAEGQIGVDPEIILWKRRGIIH